MRACFMNVKNICVKIRSVITDFSGKERRRILFLRVLYAAWMSDSRGVNLLPFNYFIYLWSDERLRLYPLLQAFGGFSECAMNIHAVDRLNGSYIASPSANRLETLCTVVVEPHAKGFCTGWLENRVDQICILTSWPILPFFIRENGHRISDTGVNLNSSRWV